MQPKGSSTIQGALGVRRSLLVGLRCQRQSVTKDFFLQNSLAISDISNKLIVVSSPGKALWSPNELASSAQMRKKKKSKSKINFSVELRFVVGPKPERRGVERRGCQGGPGQSFWEQRLCHPYSLLQLFSFSELFYGCFPSLRATLWQAL